MCLQRKFLTKLSDSWNNIFEIKAKFKIQNGWFQIFFLGPNKMHMQRKFYQHYTVQNWDKCILLFKKAWDCTRMCLKTEWRSYRESSNNRGIDRHASLQLFCWQGQVNDSLSIIHAIHSPTDRDTMELVPVWGRQANCADVLSQISYHKLRDHTPTQGTPTTNRHTQK